MATKYDIKDYLRDVKAANGRLITRTNEELQAMIDCLDELEKPRDTTYNGYPNYETWSVALWIDNNQGDQEAVLELAAQASGAYAFSKELREYVEGNMVPVDAFEGMVGDLFGAALGEVQWQHLAENYIAEAAENEEHDLKRDQAQYDITADYASGNETVFTGTALECRLWIKAKAADHCQNSGMAEYKHADYIQVTLNEWRDDTETQIGLYTYERYDHEEPEEDGNELPVRDMDDAGN